MKNRWIFLLSGLILFCNRSMGADTDTAYFVSTAGNDRSDGSFKRPFRTFERARDAVRGSSVKKVYIRKGTYQITTTFILSKEDNGSSWMGYPGDAANSAVIDGAGLNDIWLIMGGSNILISGLTVRNYSSRAIGVHGGKGWKNAAPHFNEKTDVASGNIIRHNIVEHGKIKSPAWDRAGINTEGATPHTQILNNVVRHTTGYGIGVWALQETDDISGTRISGNVILNSCTEAKDGAALYICDRTAVSKDIIVEDNFIRDYGEYENELRGVYLDDWASNVTVRANVITGKGTQPVLIHGGSNNVVTGNIIDIGSSGKPCVLNYAAHRDRPMLQNRFTGNVILSSYPEDISGGAFRKFGNVTNPEISANLYYNYSTGIVNTGGMYYMLKDKSPLTGNPHISGWDYKVDHHSMIYRSPVSFQPLRRAWGPPGYSIPQSGTVPSCLVPGTDDVYLHAESCDTLKGISRNGIALFSNGDSTVSNLLGNIHLGNGFDRMPAMAISSCDEGDWVGFDSVHASRTFRQFSARVALGEVKGQPRIEVRTGTPDGKLVATLSLVSTGGYTTFAMQSAPLQLEAGMHRLYVVFKGGTGIGHFDFFRLH